MRVVALGVLLWLAGCDRGGYRVWLHVPGEAARVVRAEVSVIGSCDEIVSMGLPSAATVQSVVVGAAGSTSIGAVPEGEYGLYARAWELECVLFAAGCETIAVDGGGEGDLHVFLSITTPLGCDALQRCSGDLCVPMEGCGDTPCSDDQVCRQGECVEAQADHDGDGYVAAVDCDDDDPEIMPGIDVPCSTSCAAGQRVCLSDGSWTECSAPDDCDCSDGHVREEPCSRCGTSERRCGDDGRWGEAGECEGQGECQAGETQRQPCDPCGTQVLRCSDQCDWLEDECVPSPETDEDEDGFDSVACGGDDCDDDDPEINPSAADGWTFETVDSEGDTGLSPSLALGLNGEVHIAYRDVLNTALRHAVDDGAGWTLETVDSEGNTGSEPSLALGLNGEVHIAYADWSNNGLRYAVNDGVGWTLEMVDLVGSWGGQPSLALDAAGAVHIAYMDDANNGLRYAVNDGAGWAFDTVDSVGSSGGYPSMALGVAGETHIAYFYFEAIKGELDLRYAVNDGAGWVLDMVDSLGFSRGHPSMALGVTGETHIAYFYDSGFIGEHDLRYAVGDGAGWTVETVDSEDSEGFGLFDPSLVLGAAGEVHIAYRATNGDLRYAVNDGAGWTFETVDSWRDTGGVLSLALGPDAAVHIAYYDRTNADLEYAFRDAVDQNCDGLLSE